MWTLCGKSLNVFSVKSFSEHFLKQKRWMFWVQKDPHQQNFICRCFFSGINYLIMIKRNLKSNPKRWKYIVTRLRDQCDGVLCGIGAWSVDHYGGDFVVFDYMLDFKGKVIEPFFTPGRLKEADVFFLAQSYYDILKRSIRNNSDMKKNRWAIVDVHWKLSKTQCCVWHTYCWT